MTYLLLDVIFVVAAVGVLLVTALVMRGAAPDAGRSAAHASRRWPARWWQATAVTLGALLVMTAVFDNVMIAADLFRYDEQALTGLRIGLMPVEDLAWPVAAVLLLPALWELLGRRRPAPTHDDAEATHVR